MKSNRKLKNYLLFPKIQFKFIAFTLLSSLITVVICVYQVYQSFKYLRSVGERVNMPANAPYFKLIEMQESLIFQKVTLAFIIGLFVSIAINFVITHRALGPFYRLKVFFRDYKKGGSQKIVFREGDYFKDLEDDINRALNNTSTKSDRE